MNNSLLDYGPAKAAMELAIKEIAEFTDECRVTMAEPRLSRIPTANNTMRLLMTAEELRKRITELLDVGQEMNRLIVLDVIARRQTKSATPIVHIHAKPTPEPTGS